MEQASKGLSFRYESKELSFQAKVSPEFVELLRVVEPEYEICLGDDKKKYYFIAKGLKSEVFSDVVELSYHSIRFNGSILPQYQESSLFS